MIPFIPTLILAFVSFISSAFVILRIVIPILPPHPLSRRVSPSEFGLPNYNFCSLSSADKSHLWLASLDILALCTFIWQAFSEYYGGPAAFGEARDATSSARLWFALTIRQTCLLVVSALTLIHIRMGRSVSFGSKHWMLWAPTLLLGLISTALSGIIAGAGVPSFFGGLLAYSTTVAVLSSAAFGSLVYTLVVIRRNLAALNDPADSWPPAKEVEDKPRPSFATEDVDALREGSSWLTSDAGSTHRDSVSNWSFTTHQTHPHSGSLRVNSAMASKASLAPKSSYWFDPPTPMTSDALIPPVPPLPSSYHESSSPTDALRSDPDPFRRDAPSRPRLGSQSSWLTSPSGSQVSHTAWSYPTSQQGGVSAVDLNAELLPNATRPLTPALSSARVLGGYGYQGESERGIASLAYDGNDVDISFYRYTCWMLTIWVPLAFSLPYILSFIGNGFVSSATPLLLVLSVTLSSPLLAMNIIMRSPIPIPTGLFDVHGEPPSVCMRSPSPVVTLADFNREYKRSGSVTVVEGRRSGDVWISQGDAVEGKGKISRAFGLMTPVPRLAVLPPDEEKEDGEMTPPLPMQTEPDSFNSSVFPNTPQSAEFGRIRKMSVQSRISGDEFASRIMIAQRHYSALATTVVVPASPEKQEGDLLTVTTGVVVEKRKSVLASSHLRSRSVSSVIGQAISTDSSPSPPPSQPLPPTPPNVRLAKQQSTRTLIHRKSYSSGFSFGALVNDDINEIDVLTAGVLPLLVPGLKVGSDMKIKDFEFEFDPQISSTVTKKKRLPTSRTQKDNGEFGVLAKGDWEGTALDSTSTNSKVGPKKASTHKRNHFSLPSLGLGKDTANSLKSEISRALATRTGGYATVNDGRRNTVWGDESVPNLLSHPPVNVATEPAQNGISLGRSMSTRNLGLRVDIPHGMDSARTSVATLVLPPLSAASTVTLFDPMTEFDPAAQSTPNEKEYQYTRKYQAAAMPRSQPTLKRSSIVYIKSSEEHAQAPTEPGARPPTEQNSADDISRRTLTQWSSRVVKPLTPKSSKQRKDATDPATKSGSNSLRTLSLLKDRDSNSTGDVAGNGFAGTRPLVLGKKKSRTMKEHDENVAPRAGSVNKHLKPLKLSRTESSKVRGLLRKDQALPSVLVRPPSDQMESIYEVR